MSNFCSPMKHISPNARILTPKPQVQQLLDLRQMQTNARNSVTWFFVNTLLFSIVLYDILYGGPAYKPICWVEWCLASIFVLNAFYHIIRYTWVTLKLQPITLSSKQRPLLGVSEDDPLFKDEASLQQKSLEQSPLNLSSININRRTTSLSSPVLNEIKDYSALNPFLKYNSPSSPKAAVSSNGSSLSKSMNISLNGSFTNEDLIRDEHELESYLKEIEQQRKCTLSTNVDQPSNLLSSFWSHSAVRTPGEVSPLLKRCAYQLAPTIDKIKATSPGAEEGSSPRGTFGVPDIWRKYRIDSNKVNEWTANLRMVQI